MDLNIPEEHSLGDSFAYTHAQTPQHICVIYAFSCFVEIYLFVNPFHNSEVRYVSHRYAYKGRNAVLA